MIPLGNVWGISENFIKGPRRDLDKLELETLKIGRTLMQKLLEKILTVFRCQDISRIVAFIRIQ